MHRFLLLSLLVGAPAVAQPAVLHAGHPGRTCATQDPPISDLLEQARIVERFRSESALRLSVDETVTIPVAMHVITDGTRGDVPDDRIQAQMDTLNSAYQAFGYRFALALVQRIDNADWYDGLTFDSPAERAMKDSLALNPARVLNVYTASLGQDFLGWASLPRSSSETDIDDGMVILDSSMPGGDAVPYNLGHTGTHEVGHWVGLAHTFAGGCSEPNDGVADTPQQRSPTSGCPTSRDSCPADPGQDPFNNYMDYSFDVCMVEFTPGQVERARALMAQFRPTIVAGGYLLATVPESAFAGLASGQTRTIDLWVTNTDDAPIRLTELGGIGGSFSAASLPVVNPGESEVVQVQVTAGGTENPLGGDRLVTSAENGVENGYRIDVAYAVAGQPEIGAPPPVEGVSIVQSLTAESETTIANVGDGPLTFEVDLESLPVYVTSVEPVSGVVEAGQTVSLAIRVDSRLVEPGAYAQALEILTNDPNQARVSVEVPLVVIPRPAQLRIDAPFPNPVRDIVTIPLALPDDAQVTAEVYDVRGRRVAVLADGVSLPLGYPALRWDTAGAADGLYLIRVTTGEEQAISRVAVTR
ncbi:MAG: M43 family zinc metalloprotease [Bacteroidota bacterium]